MKDNFSKSTGGSSTQNKLQSGKTSLDSKFQNSAGSLSGNSLQSNLDNQQAQPVQLQQAKQVQQQETLQERLDRITRTYQGMITSSRNKGYDVAADNLQRFLDGTGGTKTESVDWLRDFNALISAEETNQERFVTSLRKQALSLRDGETKQFADYWDRTFTANPFTELYYASGTSTITSRGTFTLSRSGDEITITGTVNHEWNDPYDWHAGLAAYIPGFGSISDQDALLLQQHRGAAPFHMTASWRQTLRGSYTIDNFLYFDSSEFNWTGP